MSGTVRLSKMISTAALAAGLLLAPSVESYDGIVMGKTVELAHPEWSWSQGAFVDIPTCHMLKIAKPWEFFTTWICVTPATYAATGRLTRYVGPGTLYAGSPFA